MTTRRIQSNSGSKEERTQWQQTNNEKHGMKEDERAWWRLTNKEKHGMKEEERAWWRLTNKKNMSWKKNKEKRKKTKINKNAKKKWGPSWSLSPFCWNYWNTINLTLA